MQNIGQIVKSPNRNITLRLSSDTFNRLSNEAEQKRISLNTLASQILQYYIEYYLYAPRAHLVSFPKSLLIGIMDRLSEQDMDQLSEYIIKNEFKEMILLVKNEYTLSAFLDFVESWVRISGFAYRRNCIAGIQSFVIQHNMGKRWSIYFERLIKYVCKDLNKNLLSFDMTNNSITFSTT